MADTHETIADIIAEIRAIANEKRRANDPREYEAAVSMNDYADRLDAAHRRERGDAAKLREAVAYLFTLIDMRKLVLDCDETEEISAVQVMLDECRAALAAPPRNCDVGTAEEQSERMDAAYCSKRLCAKGKCPLFKPGLDCSLIWAQMPYEEGGAK